MADRGERSFDCLIEKMCATRSSNCCRDKPVRVVKSSSDRQDGSSKSIFRFVECRILSLSMWRRLLMSVALNSVDVFRSRSRLTFVPGFKRCLVKCIGQHLHLSGTRIPSVMKTSNLAAADIPFKVPPFFPQILHWLLPLPHETIGTIKLGIPLTTVLSWFWLFGICRSGFLFHL